MTLFGRREKWKEGEGLKRILGAMVVWGVPEEGTDWMRDFKSFK